jgi:hypothetical protein
MASVGPSIACGNESLFYSSFLHVIDTVLNIQALHPNNIKASKAWYRPALGVSKAGTSQLLVSVWCQEASGLSASDSSGGGRQPEIFGYQKALEATKLWMLEKCKGSKYMLPKSGTPKSAQTMPD